MSVSFLDKPSAFYVNRANKVETKTVMLMYPFILKTAIFNLFRSLGLTRECS